MWKGSEGVGKPRILEGGYELDDQKATHLTTLH